MTNKSFNITEILESVENIVSNKDINKKEIIGTQKQFIDKKKDILINQDVEKIIIDAEKAQDDKQFKTPLILDIPRDEEISDIQKNVLSPNLEPLILLNEFKEAEGIDSSEDNNHLHEIQKLKNSKIQLDEKIKDLNILLNKFHNQERYADLDKIIKLYQEDNATLRKKILKLEETEASLRLKLIDTNQDKNIRKE